MDQRPSCGFSEPEAAMVKALAVGFKPHVWVNVHSGMEALFMPYDHRAEVPPPPLPPHLQVSAYGCA